MLVLNFNTGLSSQWETWEGYALSEEGRSSVFWIWPHKLPTVSFVGRLRWPVPTTLLRGTVRGQEPVSLKLPPIPPLAFDGQ